ncbi:MAG: ABC transporter permease [Oceanococcaceae bacterium]
MLRDIKSRYFATRLGLVWAIADPAAIVIMLVIVRGFFGVIVGGPGVSPIEYFFWPVWAFFLFSQTANATAGALGAARGLLSYRQVQAFDVIFARSLIEWSLLYIVAGIAVAGWWLFGMPLNVESPLHLVVLPLVILALGSGWGLLTEVASTVWPDARRILAIVMRPMLFISGLFFTMEMVPPDAQPWLFWNPVLHLVDMTRDAGITSYQSPGSMLYALSVTAVIAVIGFALYHRYHDIIQRP